MSWRIVMAPAGSSYLTGDAPASFLESLGLKNDEAEVVFPLASHVALHMCWQGPPGGTIRLPTSAAIVKEVNRRVAVDAVRFVFYHERQEWVARLANNPAPYLSRIRW